MEWKPIGTNNYYLVCKINLFPYMSQPMIEKLDFYLWAILHFFFNRTIYLFQLKNSKVGKQLML